MADGNETSAVPDPHDLSRFVRAQKDKYAQALAKIKGRTKAFALDDMKLKSCATLSR